MKSDESAFSIVPSSGISTSSNGSGSLESIRNFYASMIYPRLSFEDDLFTTRVYKRNYRISRSSRGQTKAIHLDGGSFTSKEPGLDDASVIFEESSLDHESAVSKERSLDHESVASPKHGLDHESVTPRASGLTHKLVAPSVPGFDPGSPKEPVTQDHGNKHDTITPQGLSLNDEAVTPPESSHEHESPSSSQSGPHHEFIAPQGSDLSYEDDATNHDLSHKAAISHEEGRQSILKLLDSEPQRCPDGRTSFRLHSWLNSAITCGDTSLVETLLRWGVNPNHCRPGGGTGLHTFVSGFYAGVRSDGSADEKTLRLLLDHIDLLAIGYDGNTVLGSLSRLGEGRDEFATTKLATLILRNIPEHRKAGIRSMMRVEEGTGKDNDVSVSTERVSASAPFLVPNSLGSTEEVKKEGKDTVANEEILPASAPLIASNSLGFLEERRKEGGNVVTTQRNISISAPLPVSNSLWLPEEERIKGRNIRTSRSGIPVSAPVPLSESLGSPGQGRKRRKGESVLTDKRRIPISAPLHASNSLWMLEEERSGGSDLTSRKRIPISAPFLAAHSLGWPEGEGRKREYDFFGSMERHISLPVLTEHSLGWDG